MSQCDFESSIKTIPYKQKDVFSKLADLTNLEHVRDSLDSPEAQETMLGQTPAEKLKDLKDKIKDVTFDRDSVSFNASPLGAVSLRIVDREEPKCVKFETQGAPVALNLWIQLIPDGEDACKMRVTARAELNVFIRGMVSKPLQEGIEKIAEVLSAIPYNNMQ